ncbi:LOW QUALITY PROTEIN: Ribosomal_S15 domain-containing protein, partial [Cephalotus follicularis]
MALSLTIPKHRYLSNPSLIHLFSTTKTPHDASPTKPSQSQQSTSQPSPFASYFSDVKSSLKQKQNPPQLKPTYPSVTNSNSSLDEISRNLSEYRRRSTVPNSTESNPHSQPVSFQEVYKRNVIDKIDQSWQPEPTKTGGSWKPPFDEIRQSISQMKPKKGENAVQRDPMSLSKFKDSLRLKPEDAGRNVGYTVIGGTGELPGSIFGKEMMGEGRQNSKAMRSEFVSHYSYKDLGDKLRALRPEGVKEGGGWFSLAELNERLGRLREIEEKEKQGFIGATFKHVRESLVAIKTEDDSKLKKISAQRLNILNQLGGTPNFMMHPPKEHLVEKYFHPDNMSSEEKLKIELAKVRDEFKMSESDCGSARVQVAQLTTKIKHLSSVLHKKDKHSRKGLLAMVQLRKKLLKYLRRTDWDSYCLVLSKLGLRDNPDYK